MPLAHESATGSRFCNFSRRWPSPTRLAARSSTDREFGTSTTPCLATSSNWRRGSFFRLLRVSPHPRQRPCMGMQGFWRREPRFVSCTSGSHEPSVRRPLRCRETAGFRAPSSFSRTPRRPGVTARRGADWIRDRSYSRRPGGRVHRPKNWRSGMSRSGHGGTRLRGHPGSGRAADSAAGNSG